MLLCHIIKHIHGFWELRCVWEGVILSTMCDWFISFICLLDNNSFYDPSYLRLFAILFKTRILRGSHLDIKFHACPASVELLRADTSNLECFIPRASSSSWTNCKRGVRTHRLVGRESPGFSTTLVGSHPCTAAFQPFRTQRMHFILSLTFLGAVFKWKVVMVCSSFSGVFDHRKCVMLTFSPWSWIVLSSLCRRICHPGAEGSKG